MNMKVLFSQKKTEGERERILFPSRSQEILQQHENSFSIFRGEIQEKLEEKVIGLKFAGELLVGLLHVFTAPTKGANYWGILIFFSDI